MATDLKQAYKEARDRIKAGMDKVKAEIIEADAKADANGVKNAGRNFRLLQKEYERIGQKYEEEATVRRGVAQQRIESGESLGFKQGVDRYVSPSGLPQERTKWVKVSEPTLKQDLADWIGTDPENVDIESGAGISERFVTEALRTPESRMEFLGKLYGPENVQQIRIGGNANYLAREGDKYKLINEQGLSYKDIVPTVVTEALPTAAALKAGTAAAATSGPAATVTTPLAAGAAYAGTGALQDVAVRGVLGMEIKPEEIAKQRAVEGLVGLGVDLVLPFVGRPVLKRLGKSFKNKVQDELEQTAEQLRKKGIEMEVPVGAARGAKGVLFEQELAGRFPNSGVALRAEKQRNVLAQLQQTMEGGNADPTAVRKAVLDNLRAQDEILVNEIAKKDRSLADAMKGLFERRRGVLELDSFEKRPLGEAMSREMDRSFEIGRQIKNDAFAEFQRQADAAGVNVLPEDIAPILMQEARKGRFAKSATVENWIRELEQAPQFRKEAADLEQKVAEMVARGETPSQIQLDEIANLKRKSDPLSAADMHELVREIRNAVPSEVVGAKTDAQVANAVAERWNKEMKRIFDDAGLGDAWQNTLKTYDEKFLSFKRSSPGAILAERFGAERLTPTQVVDRVLQDEGLARDFLSAMAVSNDPAAFKGIQQEMQKAYLANIGLVNNTGKPKGMVDFNPEIVEAVFATGIDGSINSAKAARINNTLREINEYYQRSKTPITGLSVDDVSRLLDPVPEGEKRSILKKMAEKSQLVNKQEMLAQQKMIQLAKQGKWTAVDNDEFARAMIDARPSDTRQIVRGMKPEDRKSLQTDFVANFFQRYSTAGTGKNQTKRGVDLWDGEAVVKDLKGWTRGGKVPAPDFIKNMDAVLGKETTDLIVAASKANAISRPIPVEQAVMIRTVTSPQGMKAYASGLWSGIYHRVLASAYASNNLKPMLRAMSRNIDDEQYQRNVQRMVNGVIGTRIGLQSLMHQSRNDPQFAQDVNAFLGDISAEKDLK